MRNTLTAMEHSLNKRLAINMFHNMIKRRVGTPEVEATAQRVLGYQVPRSSSEVVRIMKIRLRSVVKAWHYRRRQWRQSKIEMLEVVTGQAEMEEYRQVERSMGASIWETGRTKRREQVEFATQKVRKKFQIPTVNFYRVTDEDLENEEVFDTSSNFEVYGDVELSEAEKTCLSLGPKFMVVSDLNDEDFEVKAEMECVKQRMELSKRAEIKNSVGGGEVTLAHLESYELTDRKGREIFDRETGILNMSKQRVTDAKHNTRSNPPRMAKTADELLLQGRRSGILDTFSQFRAERCGVSGKQKKSNMTDEEMEGLRSLQKRIKNKEIVITTTDKSGKYAVTGVEAYKRAAAPHLTDKHISWDEVKSIETFLNRHSIQIVKSLRMGTVHFKQEDRVQKAYTSKGAKPGVVYFLIKDHKQIKPGEILPPVRPVCSAKNGPGSRLSNLLSTILNRATDAMNSNSECMSTEEALRKFLDANRDIKRRCETDHVFRNVAQSIIVLSMDVCALYPSLRKDEVAPIIFDELRGLQASGALTFENVDFHEVGKYLVIMCTKEELTELGIESAVPKRTTNRGPRPTVAYLESDIATRKVGGKFVKVDKWVSAENEPSVHQKHIMISKMMSVAVHVAMSNHTYRFDGNVRLQEDGGPIGDELAQAVARMVMNWWDKEFLKLCDTLGLIILLYFRYVDDTNKAIIPPPPDTRFIDGRLVVVPTCVEEDELLPKDKVVGKLLRDIANSISPMLQFEEDVASNYQDGRLPILDLKVWLEHDSNSSMIRHSFYKKPMASKLALLARTAMPTSQIRAVMVEEVLRRLRNCDPEASWGERGGHLTTYALSMLAAGHTEHFRKSVFNKAVHKYCQMLDAHKAGASDIYRSREERLRELQMRGGKSTKDNWFRKVEDGVRVTSVLRAPFTLDGELKNRITNSIKSSRAPEGVFTKVQEDSGMPLKSMLMKSDPFPRSTCNRDLCPITRGGQECRERCFQAHCNYAILCTRCDPPDEVTLLSNFREQPTASRSTHRAPHHVYLGETSRGCYIRFQSHVSGYRCKSNFMWNHVEKEHAGVYGEIPSDDFYMKLSSVDSEPIQRVVRESVRIKRAREGEEDGTRLMNDKNEWFGVRVVSASFIQE